MISINISDILKANLVLYDENEMVRRIARHYQVWQLMYENHSWASGILESYSSVLLPEAVSLSDCHAFIDQIMSIFLKNPFLSGFLEKASCESFPVLEYRMLTEGRDVIPDVLAFAMALERLTHICYQDACFYNECFRIIRKTRKVKRSWGSMPFFYRIKACSVEPVVYYCIRSHQRSPEKLGKASGSRALQVNILEAAMSDLLMGMKSNAYAGWVLAVHKAGKQRINHATGAGPNFWDCNRKAIGIRPPLPKLWADLYQVWNMAFISKMNDFPYIISKLLIPQVADYSNHPETYMYNRLIALYLYLNYFAFDTADPERKQLIRMQWNDKHLTRFWGKISRECAITYILSVKQAKQNFSVK